MLALALSIHFNFAVELSFVKSSLLGLKSKC
jgi:hypothetical protein